MEGRTGEAAQGASHCQHYGIRVLKAIGDAVPVRLMKRDLLFVLTQTFPLLNEWQLQTLARQHGIRKDRETDMLDKLFAAFPASC